MNNSEITKMQNTEIIKTENTVIKSTIVILKTNTNVSKIKNSLI